MVRSRERKRDLERRRRLEFRDASDHLFATLYQHDEDFQVEHDRRAKQSELRGNRKTNIDPNNDDNEMKNSHFNRIEVINQAIYTINKLTKENNSLKRASDLPPDLLNHQERKKARVCYHQGVGPCLEEEKQQQFSNISVPPHHATNDTSPNTPSLASSLAPVVPKPPQHYYNKACINIVVEDVLSSSTPSLKKNSPIVLPQEEDEEGKKEKIEIAINVPPPLSQMNKLLKATVLEQRRQNAMLEQFCIERRLNQSQLLLETYNASLGLCSRGITPLNSLSVARMDKRVGVHAIQSHDNGN